MGSTPSYDRVREDCELEEPLLRDSVTKTSTTTATNKPSRWVRTLSYVYDDDRIYVSCIPQNALYHKVTFSGDPVLNEADERQYLSTCEGAIRVYWKHDKHDKERMDRHFRYPAYRYYKLEGLKPHHDYLVWQSETDVWYPERERK